MTSLPESASTTDAADVDVAVVTWNTRDLTVAALQRLLAAPSRRRLRVLVHDNGSEDGTAEAIRREVPAAEVEACPHNLGFAAGVNALLARSSAPAVLLLNSDAWPEPGAIDRLADTLDAQPRAAAVAPRLETPDGTVEQSTLPLPGLVVAAVSGLGLSPRVPQRWADAHQLAGRWAHDRPAAVGWAIGAALLLRRTALEDIGGLDEQFFMYAEDLDWCWRARERGWEIRFEPAALVRHVGNASGRQHFGDLDRAVMVWTNSYQVTGRRWGRGRQAAYRALNAMAAARRARQARRRGDADGVAYWRGLARVHAGMAAVQVRSPGSGQPNE